jgi:hypothetical protein
MALARESKKAPPLPPCAVCSKPAPHAFWDTQLCAACLERWMREAPPLEKLELAHADAHPEDIEASGINRWLNQSRWCLLKPGVTEKVARQAATAWLLRAKARAA